MNKKPLTQEFSEALNIVKKKNEDYGNNINAVGAILEILHPKGIILNLESDFSDFFLLTMIVSKLCRYINLKNGTPNFESIEDSLLDLGNYAFILKNKIYNQTEDLFDNND